MEIQKNFIWEKMDMKELSGKLINDDESVMEAYD